MTNFSNKRGQAILTFILVFFGGIVYFVGFAGQVSDLIQDSLVKNGLTTGIFAFAMANINIIIFMVWLIALLMVLRQ